MIIDDRQRHAAPALQGLDVTLEVHLPQCVRMLVLEALPGLALPRRLFVDEPVAAQDPGNRGGRRHPALTQILQAPCDRGSAPAMLAAQFEFR
jgi:hypothetical protein